MMIWVPSCTRVQYSNPTHFCLNKLADSIGVWTLDHGSTSDHGSL